MKEFCRKGHLKRSGKRWLALLMSVCLIGTMIPISAKAENGSTDTGLCEHHTEHTTECGYVEPIEGHECEHEHDESCGYQEAGECEHVHDDECGYVEASEGSPCTFVCDICGKEAETVQAESKLITDWEWVDDWEIIDPDSGKVLLPFASAENVAYFDDIVEMLPTAILAGGEELPLGEWVCEDYPMESGAYEGEYVFETTLPDGYTLSDDTNVLDLTVVLGDPEGYDAEVYACTPIDTTLTPGSTFDVSTIPMGNITPRRYFINQEGTYTITGNNYNETTARFVINKSCTIILDRVSFKAGIMYEDRTDEYYGSGERGVFEINGSVDVNFIFQGSSRIQVLNYSVKCDSLNAFRLDCPDGQVTFSGTGSLDIDGRIGYAQRISGEPCKVVMKSGKLVVSGFGNQNRLVTPAVVVSKDNLQFVYEGGNFYNGYDEYPLDNVTNFAPTKDGATGDIYRVRIPVSSKIVQVKIGTDGSFSTAGATTDGNLYVWNSGVVTDYYVMDGDNYYHYRSTGSTGTNYLTDAELVTDDTTISGVEGTVKVGASTVSDATLTFTGEEFSRSCTTDSAGAYYKAMPKGTYQVSVKLSGSDVAYNMGTITLSGERKQTHNFVLTSLTGTVKDTSDYGLSNAKFSMEYDGKTYTAVSESDGSYALVLPKIIAEKGQNCPVTIQLSGLDTAYDMGEITLSEDASQTHNYVLTSLTGTVKDTSDNALQNAKISAEYDGTTYTAVTGSDGSYRLVFPNGFASEGNTFAVTANHLLAMADTQNVVYQASGMTCDFTLTQTVGDTVDVYTEDDLVMLSEVGGQLGGRTIRLQNDITLTGKFKGINLQNGEIYRMIFEGGGYTIANLTTPLFQNDSSNLNCALRECTVSNLHLKGDIVDNNLPRIGALATSITGTVIDGCSFEGSICSKKEGADVGGLIGFVWRSSNSGHRLRNCFVRLTKIDGYKANSMGGITGNTDGYIFENSYAIIDSFAGTMNTDCSNKRGAIVGYLGTDGWDSLVGSYAVVKSTTGEPVWRMAYTTSDFIFHNYSYAPEGVFIEDSISQATDLTETLMKAAAGSGTGDNEPLVDRLNNYASETSSRYKSWYNGTDGYPCFTIPAYTITFDGGTKGTGNQEAESCNLGESVTLPGVVYKNMDYVQKGWATSDGGTKAYDLGASISPTENITLYPYWEAKPVAAYTAPTGLTATYGDTLSNVSLPDGFTWNEPETSVGDVGIHTFTATYTPTGDEAETYGRDTNVQVEVEVKKAPAIYDTLVNKVTNLTYNRSAQELVTAGITSHGTIVYSLTETGTYTTEIPTETNPGNYTVYYKIQGDANHEDSEVGSVTVSIGKANLGGAVITLGDALTYNGESQTQSIASVKIGEMILEEDDYTVTGNTGTEPETYTLTVTGQGNFEGSATKKFTIAKKAATTVEDINKSYVSTAGSKDAAVSIDIASLLPTDRGETTCSLADNSAGYVTEKAVTPDGKLTYKVGTNGTVGESTTLTVTAQSAHYEDISVRVNISIVDKYGVAQKTGANVAIVGGNTLTYGQKLSELTLNTTEAKFVEVGEPAKEVTGTLAWTKPDAVLAAGTTEAEWTFTPDESFAGIYQALTGKVAIVVNKATPTIEQVPTVAERTYHPNTKLSDISLTGGTVNVDGTWSWQTGDTVPTAGNNEYVAVFTPNDTANYDTTTRGIGISVTKATPHIITAPTATMTYGEKLGDVRLTGGSVQYSASDAAPVVGSFAWADGTDLTSQPAVADSGVKTYHIVFKPAESGNYNGVEQDITITVNKAKNAPNMPGTVMNVANSCKKVRDITLRTGWVWQDADKNKALTVGTAVEATAVYNGADKGNYETESVTISITRSECEHVASDILYTGQGEKAPTCTVDGKGHRECTKCRETIESNIIVKAEHQFSTQWTIDKPATTTEEGEKSRHCTVCDARTEITVIPKLSTGGGSTGGGGIGGGDHTSQFWPDAKKELEQALNQQPGKEPPVVTIDIKDHTTVPKDVLETIKGKNIEVVFDLRNGMSWKLNGNDITNLPSDLDLGVNTNTNNIPVDVINKVTKEKTSLQLSLNHNGDFGFTATLTVNLDPKNKGLYANLYYYNPKAAKGKELEFISAGKIDDSGNADLQFTHASDYVIVIDRTPADTKNPVEDSTITKEKWTLNSNIMNKLAKLGWKKSALKVQWSKVEGAEGYDIYATTYGGKITAKTKVASVAANKTSLSISKVLGKKVSNQTGYKVRAKAYRMVEGKKQYLGETMDLFTVGSKHKSYTNVSKVTPKNTTITLTVGKTKKVTTTLTKANQKKKLIPAKYVASRRYFVEDSTIVKVDQKGNLTGLKKGKTTLYIKAANGTTAKVTVTVK